MMRSEIRLGMPALLFTGFTFVLLLAMAQPATAQPAPPSATAPPVRVVVPFLNGDFEDRIARIIVDYLKKNARRAFVVENRPGGFAYHGAEVVARARPDGGMVLFAPLVYYATESILFQVRYDLLTDFTPVTLVANAPQVLLAHPSLPVKTVNDLITLLKTQPGQVKWGVHDEIALPGLQTDLFRLLSGAKVDSITYRDGARVISQLLEGEIALAFHSLDAALPHITAGRLRALAVSGAQRSALLPQVPTMTQSGIKEHEADYWYAILAPDGTDAATVAALRDDFARAVASDEVRKQLLALGIEALSSTPADLGRLIRAELAKWRRVAEQARPAK
jgi:tripartite-type tricarboxylate transporter receptor subunit TctC